VLKTRRFTGFSVKSGVARRRLPGANPLGSMPIHTLSPTPKPATRCFPGFRSVLNTLVFADLQVDAERARRSAYLLQRSTQLFRLSANCNISKKGHRLALQLSTTCLRVSVDEDSWRATCACCGVQLNSSRRTRKTLSRLSDCRICDRQAR
jgi:hypothetical protein